MTGTTGGKLSDVERNRSKGVAVVHYTDGDYRCLWFTPGWFTDDEDAWWDVDADWVRDKYVPDFRDRVNRLMEEPGEPMIACLEVYWDKTLIHEEEVGEYTPVALPSEGGTQ